MLQLKALSPKDGVLEEGVMWEQSPRGHLSESPIIFLKKSSMGVLYHNVQLCLSCHLEKKKKTKKNWASLISTLINTSQCCLCTSQSFNNPGLNPITTHINTFRHQTTVRPFGQKQKIDFNSSHR